MVNFTATKKITPVHIIAFYTITNIKDTPSLISELSLEMSGAGQTWWILSTLPTSQALWAADMRHPKGVQLITLPAGFLKDKIANRKIAPGEPVQGWILCQIPREYLPSHNGYDRLRLRIKDTANNEMVQEISMPTNQNYVLSYEMQVVPIHVDLSTYEITAYPNNEPMVTQ